MEQYLQQSAIKRNFNKGDSCSFKCKSLTSTFDESETDSSSASSGFDCNICLDLVVDPIVTFCGHLYCWPCIYKWISSKDFSIGNPDPQQPQCPVCKAEISQKTLIPLYGRGNTSSKDEETSRLDGVVPQRPKSTTINALYPVQQSHNRNYLQSPPSYHQPENFIASPMLDFDSGTMQIGMFGEMIYARFFGNSQGTMYTYPNTYDITGNGNHRVRRHLMKVDESLSRVCFFLCCCVVLCLLLF